MGIKSSTLVVFVGLFGYVAGLGACSSSTSSSSSTTKTLAGFCSKWAANACNDKVVAACGGPDASKEACRETQAAACELLVGADYDATNAADCLKSVKDAYADAKLNRSELDALELASGACAELVKGAGVKGASCSADADCDTVEGFRCVGDSSPTCQIPVSVSGGGKCTDPASECAEGFYCNGQNCVAGAELGASCVAEPCVQSLDCVAGTCSAKAANFRDCKANADCESGLCDIPRSASVGTCVSELALGLTAGSCVSLR